jgi:beta-glucosidase
METPFPGAHHRVNRRRFEVDYNEGLKVGYKWYDAEDKQPLFAFGFGLSYTSYAYSDLKVMPGQAVRVSFNVKNTGARAGAEIAQVYVSLPPSTGEPPKRLVAWHKVGLAPGATKTIKLTLDPHYLSIFNADKDKWELVAGDYKFWVGGSSRNLPLSETVKIGN